MNFIKQKIERLLDNINTIYLYYIIIFLLVIVLILSVLCLNKKTTVVKEKVYLEAKQTEKKITNFSVDIKGMVANPGVYVLKEDSRVIDAIELAGGLLEDADTTLINLSKKIKDEMTIIIYSKEEIKKYKEDNKKIEYVYIEVESCPDKVNEACITPYKEEKNKIDNSEETLKNSKISLNSGTIEELMKLTGIGEAKAKQIIEYRTKNNGFKNIEEIKNVNGIGESAFEKIKDNITI